MSWTVVTGQPGSGLRRADPDVAELAIDADDPEPAEYDALAATGATMLLRITLAEQSDMNVVLRVGARRLQDPCPGILEVCPHFLALAGVGGPHVFRLQQVIDGHRSIDGQLADADFSV